MNDTIRAVDGERKEQVGAYKEHRFSRLYKDTKSHRHTTLLSTADEGR